MSNTDIQFSYRIILLAATLIVLLLHTTAGFSPDSQVSQEQATTPQTTIPTISTANGSFESGSDKDVFQCSHLKNREQRKLCINTTGLREILMMTEKRAQDGCKIQFRKHKWRCYGFTMLEKANITKRACKESSYVYSLASAILTYTVAESCQNGLINCTIGNTQLHNQTIITASDYVLYGMSLAQRFLDAKEYNRKSLSDRQRLNLHNNKLGRLVVYNNMHTDCSCHGLSTGCTLKFCEKVLPKLEEISAILKKLYDTAYRVRSSSYSDNFLVHAAESSPKHIIGPQDIIYFDQSPDFCYRDTSIGLGGVKGHQCDAHGTTGELESCSNSCCGRGYGVDTLIVEYECVKFVWCCTVEYDVCQYREQVYRCK